VKHGIKQAKYIFERGALWLKATFHHTPKHQVYIPFPQIKGERSAFLGGSLGNTHLKKDVS
jgi:hypothetical protein